jgi:DNA-directed RNA polymerase subunit beta
MARTIRERMNVRDNEGVYAIDLINAKTLSSGNSFFGNKPIVSVYGSNTNHLRLRTNEDYLHLDQVDFREKEQLRYVMFTIRTTDVFVPIETPEGPNIGLISLLEFYAK